MIIKVYKVQEGKSNHIVIVSNLGYFRNELIVCSCQKDEVFHVCDHCEAVDDEHFGIKIKPFKGKFKITSLLKFQRNDLTANHFFESGGYNKLKKVTKFIKKNYKEDMTLRDKVNLIVNLETFKL